MKKYILRIAAFLSLFLVYFIVKEFLQLYYYTYNIAPWAGYVFLGAVILFTGYFAVIPFFRILTFPRHYSPVKNRDEAEEILKMRINRFRKNKFLKTSGYNMASLEYTEESYNSVIKVLEEETEKIRKRYVLGIFYSTAVSQNGFLDAILIFSHSINLIKEIFVLYHGRVSNRDLWSIYRKIYYSIAIGGSEGIEYVTDELYSKLATDTLKSIPFTDKIISSLADGFINASLLTRISLITENYCKKIYIKSDRELYPNIKTINSVTKTILSDIFERTSRTLVSLVKEKGKDFFVRNIYMKMNPARYILDMTGEIKEEVENVMPGSSLSEKIARLGEKIFRKK